MLIALLDLHTTPADRTTALAQLVRELSLLAAGDGITHFTATVLAQNRAVLDLMRHSGWRILTTEDGPYVDVIVTLPGELLGDGRR